MPRLSDASLSWLSLPGASSALFLAYMYLSRDEDTFEETEVNVSEESVFLWPKNFSWTFVESQEDKK